MKYKFLLGCAFFLNINFLYSQSLGGFDSSILESLSSDQISMIESSINQSNEEAEISYESISQANFSNSVNQLKRLSETEMYEAFRKAEIEKTNALAIELCQRDPNACYLVENFQNYQDDVEPKSELDLDLFGIDLFSSYPLSNSQVRTNAFPASYVLRPLDTIELQIVAQRSLESQKIKIDREGVLAIPLYGSVSIVGLTVSEARNKVKQYISEKAPGAEVYFSIFRTNALDVYVIGSVKNPGLYSVSSVARTSNAVIASGGFIDNASLRNVEIYRNGEIVEVIDLYNFFINGEIDNNLYLNDEDTIRVKSTSNIVSIYGAINRPAKYEFKEGELFSDLVRFSLGLKQNANPQNITLKRQDTFGNYVLETVTSSNDFVLEKGDVFFVGEISPTQLNAIELIGSIRNPGIYPHSENTFLGDLLNLNTDILSDTYKGIALVKRFNDKTNSYSFFKIDLLDQLNLNQVRLFKRDKVFVFSMNDIDFINSTVLSDFLFSANRFVERQPVVSLSSEDTNNSYRKDTSCLSAIKTFSNKDFISSLKLKYKLFTDFNDIPCTDLFNANPDLIPYLLNNSVPVFGALSKPMLYPVSNNISSLDLISIAGGTTNSVPLDNSYVDAGTFDDNEGETLNKINLKYLLVKSESREVQESFEELVGALVFIQLIHQQDSLTYMKEPVAFTKMLFQWEESSPESLLL